MLLNRVMFPYILLISLVALAMGILNADNHFLTPALAPVLLNLCMIAAALLGPEPPSRQPGPGPGPGSPGRRSGSARTAATGTEKKRLPLAAADRFPPSGHHPGSPTDGPLTTRSGHHPDHDFLQYPARLISRRRSISYLYFADRLIQFPLGIFAVALGTAVLPALSRAAAGADWEDFSLTLSLALRLLIFIILPAMVGLIALSRPIVYLLFQHGLFTAASTSMTANTIIAYAVGLWAYAGIRVIVPAFHSLQDTKTPVKIGGLALLSNLVCAVVLMRFFDHLGLALATAISSAVNCLLLLLTLRKKLGREIRLEGCGRALLQTTLACALMLGVIVLLDHWGPTAPAYTAHLPEIFKLLLKIGAGGLTYVFSSRLLGNRELVVLGQIIKKRRQTKAARARKNV